MQKRRATAQPSWVETQTVARQQYAFTNCPSAASTSNRTELVGCPVTGYYAPDQPTAACQLWQIAAHRYRQEIVRQLPTAAGIELFCPCNQHAGSGRDAPARRPVRQDVEQYR